MPLEQKEAYGLHPAPYDISRDVFTASVMKNIAYDQPDDVVSTEKNILLLTEQNFLVRF